MKPKLLGPLIMAVTMSCGSVLAEPGAPVNPPGAEGEVAAEAIPPQVVDAAVAAVAKLGEEVVLGRYQVAVDRMYPVWKERAAKRSGGMEVLEQQLATVPAVMAQQGRSIISCKPQGQPRAYEVTPGVKLVKENGANVGKLAFTKWLVLVPTVTKTRIMREGNPKPLVIESTGYQVAIADKGKNNWTFIGGAELTLSDLRALFGTLPQTMKLPPVEEHESR